MKTSAEQTPIRETTELEPAGTVCHTARTKRDDSSDRGEPATKPEQWTKERKVLQYDSEDSEDDNMSDVRRHREEKTETDAKAGSTQHSPPKKSNSTSQNRTTDRTGRHKKRLSTSTSRNASVEGRKRDQRKRSSPRETRREEDDSEDASLGSSSEEETVATPKHIIKPLKFDGQGSFETFMAQFSNCAEHNKWNEAQKLAYLCSALDRGSLHVVGLRAGRYRHFARSHKILKTIFGGKAMSDKHRIELRNRRRKADETLQSVHRDIRRLAALAYPNVPPEMHEEVTCDHFLDALGDPDLVFKIRERHPADLDSALKIALQLEVWAKETTRHQDTSKSGKGDGRRVVPERGTGNRR